ncbi:MAG: BamA/TamA family outer membrane protein [Vicingaceae bacterium]
MHAQTEQDSIAEAGEFNIYPLPVVYYTPETRFGFGGVGISSFRFKGDWYAERNSFFQIGGAYTQEDQLLFYLPFQLFLKQNQYNVFGELGYYRYSYFFYGVGADLPQVNEELYYVNFPRFRLNMTKLVAENFYLGFRYWFDDYRVKQTESGGILSNELVTGANGGVVSSLGIIGLYDSRDNYNYPTKGSFLQALALPNSTFLGSDFDFIRYSIDYVQYHKLFKQTVVAVNLFGVAISGNPPFNEQAFIGGREKMRGFYEGRFRDRNLLMAQVELRQWLIWKVGMVAFAGSGVVAPEMSQYALSNLKHAAGIGFRYQLNEEDRINIRLDYGFGLSGTNSSGFYLTIGEAF